MRGRPRLHGLWLIWLGVVCLIVVALTHVAEGFHIFPSMGWGLPDSPGHYLDLVSAVFGLALPRGWPCCSRDQSLPVTKQARQLHREAAGLLDISFDFWIRVPLAA
jgi:hypothetical protein